MKYLLLPFLVLISSCSTHPFIDYSPSPTVTAQEALTIAESYRTHHWKPSESNIKHGLDKNGILVHTPDTTMDLKVAARPGWWKPNQINLGIPYMWGGFDTPAEFDQKITQGYYAGDVYTSAKRAKLKNGVSSETCGVDCSGFISRCWRLDQPYSTRELASLCSQLASFKELKAGDIVNKHNVHVLLFDHWIDQNKTTFMAYETGSAPTWKVLRHKIAVNYVKNLGYLPYRYKGIK